MHHGSRSIFDLGEGHVAGLQLFDNRFGQNAGFDEPT
jgi:hypothetical protein